MPLPLLFIGIGAAAGALGIGKTVKASIDQKEANETNERADDVIRDASNRIETARKKCGTNIENLGKCKIKILNNSIKPFIEIFEKINYIEISNSMEFNELQKIIFDKKKFSELKEIQSIAASLDNDVIDGIATGVAGGVLTAFGAYSIAGALATASTGTAIASLSGIAATNATLAFFGGGSLAVGGLGIAGGTMILGGLIAGPALAIFGSFMSLKASSNLEKAYLNLEKAQKYEKELKAVINACKEISERANKFTNFLTSIDSNFFPLTQKMSQIIVSKGTDYRNFSSDEKKIIGQAITLAGAIKSILDTPILDKDGNLTPESDRIIDSTNAKLLRDLV